MNKTRLDNIPVLLLERFLQKFLRFRQLKPFVLSCKRYSLLFKSKNTHIDEVMRISKKYLDTADSLIRADKIRHFVSLYKYIVSEFDSFKVMNEASAGGRLLLENTRNSYLRLCKDKDWPRKETKQIEDILFKDQKVKPYDNEKKTDEKKTETDETDNTLQ